MLQLSIVIPAYNAGCWIEQLIESLAEQQGNYFEEFEIIITDDGSTDNTVKVVEKSKQKYATLQLTLLRQRNLGVSAARNYGIEQAKGRFCWFVDADVSLSERYYHRVNTTLCQRPCPLRRFAPEIGRAHV